MTAPTLLATVLTLAAGAGDQHPQLLAVSVGLVRITSTRPGTDKPWTVPGERPKSGGCDALAGIATAALGPAGVVTKFLCASAGGDAKAQRHSSSAPDLYVRVSLGRGATFRSYTVAKSFSHSFEFRVVVPTAAVPRSGLTVQVIDDDGTPNEETKEVIGSVRLTPSQLVESAAAGTVITQSDGGVEKIEITVEAADGTPRTRAQPLDVSKGIANLSGFPVAAGEVVEVQAHGEYRMRGRGDLVTPVGLSPGTEVAANFPDEPFRSGPHAAGLVRVGKSGVFRGFLVAPCATFVSPYDGFLSLGINETRQARATGDVTFDITARPATVAELAAPSLECSSASRTPAASTATWAAAAAESIAGRLRERGDGLAAAIVKITHPSGHGPSLLDLRASAGAENVAIVITAGWRGGLTSAPYQTTVRWEFNERRHIRAAVVADTALMKVAPKNATALDEYFRDEVFKLVER